MSLPSLKRRFLMKHMPEVLTANSPEERATQRQHAFQAAAHRGDPLPRKALSFCRHHNETASDDDILTEFFGIGRDRLFHSEEVLSGVDIAALHTLDDILVAKAVHSASCLPEDVRPDTAIFIAEERRLYQLRLMNRRPGTNHAQRLIVCSLRHALQRLLETMTYEHLRALIPELGHAGGTTVQSTQPPLAEHPLLSAVLPHLAETIEEHLEQLAPAYESQERILIGTAGSPQIQGHPQREFVVLDPEAHTQVRLPHFEDDLLRDVLPTPYAAWEADIRNKVTSSIYEQLQTLLSQAREHLPTNVASLADYRKPR